MLLNFFKEAIRNSNDLHNYLFLNEQDNFVFLEKVSLRELVHLILGLHQEQLLQYFIFMYR